MSRTSMFMQGVKVLDLSRHLPGPLATLFMVDMGARVIKVESPSGDEVRTLGPRGRSGNPVYFDTLNTGKEFVQLDLKTDDGRREFLRLTRDADVLIESFRPGVMERLGLGYDVLSVENPGLIYCALSGFGRGGPWEKRAAHDANYLALAGALDRNRTSAPPLPFEPPVADSAGSLFGVVAVLGALRARSIDGKGCEIDVALADAAMPLQMLQIAEMDATGVEHQAGCGLFSGGTAYYSSYQTRDNRFVMLGAVEPKFWQSFCAAANRPEWNLRQSDPLPQTSLHQELAAMFIELTLEECRSRFDDADCCFSAVLTLYEGVATEHVQARGLLLRDGHGSVQALLPVRVNGRPPAGRSTLHSGSVEARTGEGST